MQQTATYTETAKKLLLQTYADNIKSTFKPTTRAFLNNHPNAPEAQILKRYIVEFANNAMAYRNKDLPLNIIGKEYRDALDYTPTSPDRLDYILAGQESTEEMLYSAVICSGGWKIKLIEIEAKIASQQ